MVGKALMNESRRSAWCRCGNDLWTLTWNWKNGKKWLWWNVKHQDTEKNNPQWMVMVTWFPVACSTSQSGGRRGLGSMGLVWFTSANEAYKKPGPWLIPSPSSPVHIDTPQKAWWLSSLGSSLRFGVVPAPEAGPKGEKGENQKVGLGCNAIEPKQTPKHSS
jgi:hypothetical protein